MFNASGYQSNEEKDKDFSGMTDEAFKEWSKGTSHFIKSIEENIKIGVVELLLNFPLVIS